MNCDQHSATWLNIDDRNQLWSKRHCGNETSTLSSCIGLMKEQRVYFIRIYFGMRWKLLSCWSCKEIRPYLQHLTVWIPQFPDENRIHLNLQCRTLFQLVIQLSILFRIFWCNIALQQRIYEVWYIDPVRSTISARLQELCIFNWQFPTEHILTHDCSITTGSVCYDIQFNRECHSPNFCIRSSQMLND